MYNIAMSMEQFDPACIWFKDVRKNTMMEGYFTKLLYTHEWMTLNGVVLLIPVHILGTDTIFSGPQPYKKVVHYSCVYMHALWEIEREILEAYQQMFHCHFKTPVFRLHFGSGGVANNIHKKTSKVGVSTFGSLRSNRVCKAGDTVCLELKLVGVWETSTEIGLMYKFL
jgi:hypothetical protein